MKKAFFLDRDGVIIHDADYLSRPEQVELIPGVTEALRRIHEAGFLAVAVSNQSGIARGYFTMDDLAEVEKRIDLLLAEKGEKIDKWYYCPHHPKGKVPLYAISCSCRKPAPGLILTGCRELDIDAGESFIIGDKLSDIQAGVAAGLKGYAKVATGHGSEEEKETPPPGMFRADSLLPAVEKLLAGENNKK
jgi:D-glycero-D-manno-heptose 1,7-bisphosphate phosphatase